MRCLVKEFAIGRVKQEYVVFSFVAQAGLDSDVKQATQRSYDHSSQFKLGGASGRRASLAKSNLDQWFNRHSTTGLSASYAQMWAAGLA